MKKTLLFLISITFLLGMVTTSFGQIIIDGDSTDWEGYPILIDAPNNQDGMFPPEVGAAVSDRVDIKAVKATVIGNVLFGYLEFWGGPAWPNNAYENDHEGTIYYESRGYYHILIDVDNDATTGWSTDWYEAHYTPLGYLISQGAAAEPIGAEIMTEWGARMKDQWQIENEGAQPISSLDYWAADYSEYDGQTDNGSDYEIFNMAIPYKDSAKVMKWEGSLKIDSSDDPALLGDTLKSYWNGHAWGFSFLEFGAELTPFQKYYMHKDGSSVLQPGDVIGICGMTETPIDDWGVDMTTRGEVTLPTEIEKRPNRIKFDGDDSDWADIPVIADAPDNIEGYFPAEVKAATSDIVDIKELKAFYDSNDDMVYFLIRFWGGPVFPNHALDNEGSVGHRGHYHILFDLDNDMSTGVQTSEFNGELFPLGYYISQDALPADAALGAEAAFSFNYKTERSDSAFPVVSEININGADASLLDMSRIFDPIYNFDQAILDSATIAQFDGYLNGLVADADKNLSPTFNYFGYAWGYDFIEGSVPMSYFRDYFKAVYGKDWLQMGQQIALCAYVETPINDWGKDFSPKGVIDIAVDVEKDQAPEVVEKFDLANNYPNPFNPSTKIQYAIPTSEFVSLRVYDIIGREVATLVNKQQNAGVYDVEFNASKLTSGVYFYKIEAGTFTSVKKMLLLK
ncbi:hypothetical protein MNBD_IGNAVI01-783 [hydrothermal vent metagenome]|uniref:Secretion system C-terminal sorting domain-containing protein n=1 Tax=hydrothermal vent metagenome TaxID=652676 RepID=A0A3B1CAZ0_9ZZZZ